MTDFFSKISGPLEKGVDISMALNSKNGEMTVMVSMKPVDETAEINIPTLLLSGTKQDLDQEFFEHFNNALQKVEGVQSNMKKFRELMQKEEQAAVETAKKLKKKLPASLPEKKHTSEQQELF